MDDRSFTIDAVMREQLTALFEWIVDPTLVFLRKRVRECAPSQDMSLVASLMNVFEAGRCRQGTVPAPPLLCVPDGRDAVIASSP